MHRTATLAGLALFSLSCGGVDVTPVSDVLRASASLALGGAGAMAAMAGEAPDCVRLTPACTGAPCAARVEVEVSDACPLALGVGEGTVVLDGQWSDEDTGTFVPDLTNLQLGVTDGVALNLGVVVLSRPEDDVVQVTFGEQGASVDDGEEEPAASVGQAAYNVRVTLGGTPADLGDDELEISGGGQAVSGTHVQQIAVATARTQPSCRENPVEGTATLGGTGSDDVSNTSLFFHPECDGEADVIASTVDPSLTGGTIPLELVE